MISKMTPLEWYEQLGRAVKSARAAIRNRQAGFEPALDEAASLIRRARDAGASIWWVGNGGSAAICSHLAQDMMNKLSVKSLYHGDSSLLTCMANDFGYRDVYARPLATLAEKGDLLIAISSSGNSENILRCVDLAEKKGMGVITLSGFDPSNKLWNRDSDVSFFVASHLYGIVEMSHEAILHGLIETMWLDITQQGREKQ